MATRKRKPDGLTTTHVDVLRPDGVTARNQDDESSIERGQVQRDMPAPVSGDVNGGGKRE